MRFLVTLLCSVFCLSANAELKILIIDTGLSTQRTELTKYVDSEYKANYEDFHGHGTHVTSLILKNACEGVKIIPCRFYGDGRLNQALNREIKCLKLGLKMKVDMVNMSLNGKDYSREEAAVLKKYEEKKIPVHVALGNEGSRSKAEGTSYPADLDLKNLVRVGGLSGHNFAKISNIRSNSVYLPYAFIAADRTPGKTRFMKGTSQATAYYTGLQVKKYCEAPKK